jgi:hypothetical protein
MFGYVHAKHNRLLRPSVLMIRAITGIAQDVG